jgi:hypothetical protein
MRALLDVSVLVALLDGSHILWPDGLSLLEPINVQAAPAATGKHLHILGS